MRVVRVLLVEDDPDSRALLESWVRWMGHEVLSTASAVEAVALINSIGVGVDPGVDVAVMDIVMPDISGLQLLNHLRQHPSFAEMPAIFLSASDLQSDRVAARAAGAQFMAKPATRSVLQAAIEAALL